MVWETFGPEKKKNVTGHHIDQREHNTEYSSRMNECVSEGDTIRGSLLVATLLGLVSVGHALV